jgi:hypothetical protein
MNGLGAVKQTIRITERQIDTFKPGGRTHRKALLKLAGVSN